MFPSLFWCLYHLILPLPKGPIGNLRSWYKICYFVNCVWKSATFHCYIRFLELPSSTTTSILTGMFQTPHHHETPQENTPPWGQNAQWPPLSWPRLRKFSSPTRNPPNFFPPWKSWRKQTLNEPIKKQLWRLETSRREKLLSSGFVGWRWCSREAKDFQFAALQWANKTWKKPDHSSGTWWTMKSRSSSKNILLEEKKVRISSYCSFNHSENIWYSNISWYNDYSGSSLYLWYGQHHQDMTIDFVAAANWWTLPPFQTCRH